jgi:undecaprenyl-diphosphatase
MDTILKWDIDLTLAINQFHAGWFDPVMIFWSQKWVWLPLYGSLLYLLFLKLKRPDFYRSLVMIAVLITLSDQTASAILKPMFERLRPCHDPILLARLHLPDGCGGQFGFASSHSANCFGLATFMFLVLRSKVPLVKSLFIWALITGWSRIYLGAHFAGDVLAGFAIGSFWAWLVYMMWKKWSEFSSPEQRGKSA